MDIVLRFLTVVAYAAVFMVSTSANATIIHVGPGSPITLSAGTSGPPDEHTISFSPTPASDVGYSGPDTGAANTDFPNQSVAAVQGVIETFFGTGAGALTNVGLCNGAGCSGGGSSQSGNGTTAGSYSATAAFNYLALHYDNKELIFEFLNPIMNFQISGLRNGISNWRSYSSLPPGTAVPIPAAVWLFGSSLGLLGLVRHKQRNDNIAGFAAVGL